MVIQKTTAINNTIQIIINAKTSNLVRLFALYISGLYTSFIIPCKILLFTNLLITHLIYLHVVYLC